MFIKNMKRAMVSFSRHRNGRKPMALCICMMNSPQKRREQGGVMRLNKFRPNRRQPEVLRGRKGKRRRRSQVSFTEKKDVFWSISLFSLTLKMVAYG